MLSYEEGAHTAEDQTGAADGDVTARPRSPVHWLIGAHWLGRWRTPLAVRLWRYGAGSVVAFATSTVVLFVCLSLFDMGAITSTVIAFLAGAIPNWVLNRRWAWERRGRDGVVKETTLYVIVSVVALVASSAADKFTAVETAQLHNDLVKNVLVTVSYMFSVVVLTGLKYVAYDRLVFVDRRGSAGPPLSKPGPYHDGTEPDAIEEVPALFGFTRLAGFHGDGHLDEAVTSHRGADQQLGGLVLRLVEHH